MDMYNAFYEGAVVMPDNIQTPPNKKRLPHISLSLILIVLVVLVVAGLIVYKLTYKRHGFPIVIGTTRITAQDVTTYAAQVKAYKKLNPNTQFGSSPTQVAVDDLVLNAAFKNEAQKRNQPLTDADVIPASMQQYYTAAEKAKFISNYHTEAKLLQVRAQNVAYEEKFSDTLIAKKNLMVAGISIDTPYFNQAPKSQVQSLYDQAKARLQNTIMPLLQQKASDNTLSKHVDLTFKNGYLTKGTNDYQTYFHKNVLSIDIKTGYTAGEPLFNDQNNTDYIRGNVGKPYSTADKISSLKNVGDHTDVFLSKSGVLMIIRLDSKNGGTYKSWDDFLARYKQQYNLTSNGLTKQLGAKVSASFSNAISSLASIGAEQVSAAVPGGCSQHNVQFTGRSWDLTVNAPIGGGGTTFHENRPVASYTCPGTVSGNASATTGGPNNTINDNCFAPPPSWFVDSLVGGSYAPVSGGPYSPNTGGVTWDNSPGGQSVAIRSGPNSDCFGGGNLDGFPPWDPSHINDTGHIYMCFLYRGHIITCADTGTCPTGGGDSSESISCTNFSVSAASGDYKTYWITDDTGNTEKGFTNTAVNGTATGSFTPLGQVITLHAYAVNSHGGHGTTHTWSTSGSCYSAVCSMSVSGNLPDGGVLVGSTYTVTATIYNTSSTTTLLANMPGARGHSLDLTMGPGGGPGPGVDIGPGGAATFSFNETAPGGPGGASVGGYPDYHGDFGLGPGCGTSFNVETRSAACNIDSVTGPINPGGYVQAGQAFTVTATITNTGTSELASSDNGNPFSFNHGDNGGNNSYWNFPDQNLGVNLFPGQSVTISFPQTANLPSPPSPAQEALWGHVAYSNDFALGGQCSANIDMYVPFTLAGGSSSISVPSDEDPSSFNYKTWVTSTAPVPVDGASTSSAYKQPAGGGQITMVGPTGSNGPYTANGQTYILNGNAAVIPPLIAGDKYFAEIDLGYTSAFVGANGPADVVGATGPQAYANHFTVTNKPFFKVYGSGVAAGGAFSPVGGSTCSSGTGELASWNNDSGTNPVPGYAGGGGPSFGAGAQFNALSLTNIVGFASAQTAFGRSPTDLAFANSGAGVNISTDTYSPSLGGNFGGAQCLTDVTKPTGGDTTNVPGSYTLPATTINPGDNKSIFVNGDVYISGNVTYGPGWTYTAGGTNNTVPSLVLSATGNIYISPNVTELDGLYIAKPNSAGVGGKIYTCYPGFGPVPASYISNLFNEGCNNQLAVYGNFEANQVNMMRTYGSLRDETPSPGTPGTPGTPGAPQALVWNHAGGANDSGQGGDGATTGMNCTQVNEPWDSTPFTANTWDDNYLCVPSSSSTKLNWSFSGLAAAQHAQTPYCTPSWGNVVDPYGVPSSGIPSTNRGWVDNYLCSNYPISFQVGNPDPTGINQYCTLVNEPADNEGGNVWQNTYVCIAKPTSGTPPGPATAHAATPCSNSGTQSSARPTCAAEVFDFSPEFYLSKPNIGQPSGGATQFKARTALPPVL
jgi:hypothetical protein